MTRTSLLSLVALALLVPSRGWADDRPAPGRTARPADEGRRLFETGLGHFAAGRFADAVVAFRQSVALEPNPKVRVNLAMSLWRNRQPVEAATELDELLADPGVAPVVAERALALRSEIAAEIGLLEVSAVGAGPVLVDGVEVGRAPVQRKRVWLAPGAHELRFGARRDPIRVTAGSTQRLALDSRASAEAADGPADTTTRAVAVEPARSRLRWIVPAALAGGALATGVTFGLAAEQGQHQLDDLNRASSRHDYAVARATVERAERDALIANLAFATAGVAAVVTAWVIFDDRRRVERIEVGVADGGAYAVLRGGF